MYITNSSFIMNSTNEPNKSGQVAESLCTAKLAEELVSDTNKYISSLSPKEYKAYLIAKSHLDMSFDTEKSVGFLQYKASNSSSD